jgi:hypothetical protein
MRPSRLAGIAGTGVILLFTSIWGHAVPEAHVPPWNGWVWDENLNEIHDSIDAKALLSEVVEAAVHYSKAPSDSQWESLNETVDPKWSYRLSAIPAIIVEANASSLLAAADLEGAVAVDFISKAGLILT